MIQNGMCLMSSKGWLHMDSYDDLPYSIREFLKSSKINLCSGCVHIIYKFIGFEMATIRALSEIDDLIYSNRKVNLDDFIHRYVYRGVSPSDLPSVPYWRGYY